MLREAGAERVGCTRNIAFEPQQREGVQVRRESEMEAAEMAARHEAAQREAAQCESVRCEAERHREVDQQMEVAI